MIILSAGEEARFGDDRLCPYYLAARMVIGWLVRGFMYWRGASIGDHPLSGRGKPTSGTIAYVLTISQPGWLLAGW